MPTQTATSLVPLFLFGVLVVIGALGMAIWYQTRRLALRNWRRFATEIQGEFKAKNSLAPERVFGTLYNRPYVLEAGVSHEDDAPYYHTRGAFPIKNPSNFIMGLRRKSLLEEVQTLRERKTAGVSTENQSGSTTRIDVDDPDFERRFFVISNQTEVATSLLNSEVRRELTRYPDIEIYVRINEIEWRRAGEIADMRVIQRLNDMLNEMVIAIDALPKRTISLSERLAADELIAKGI